MMIYLGIDPGLDGAVAAINRDGCALWVAPTPTIGKRGKGKRQFDEAEMLTLLQRAALSSSVDAPSGSREVRVALEFVAPRPGEGCVASFSFGAGWGLWRGLCLGLGLHYELLRPQRWQAAALADVPGCEAKARAEWAVKARHARFCRDELPKVARAKKTLEGIYDALCIAEGLRRLDGRK